jgi:hypothetical protein
VTNLSLSVAIQTKMEDQQQKLPEQDKFVASANEDTMA